MRKFFEYIGLITLMCFSFFITEKTSTIAKNVDEIMIEIKANYKNFEHRAVDAKITDNKISPGICGRKVDINKTYVSMKKMGIYNESLYVYENFLPNISLETNRDKLITSGNSNQGYVYIYILLTDENKNYLNDYSFSNYNFIVNSDFYIENKNLIFDLINKNNSILLLNTDYKSYKKILKDYLNETSYLITCYNNNGNKDYLNICSSNGSNSIAQVDKQNTLVDVKNNLKRGKFINLELNKNLIDNLKFLEKYIDSKGMSRSTVDQTLKEC